MLRKICKKLVSFGFVLTLFWATGYVAFVLFVLTVTPSQHERTTDAVVVLTGGTGRVETGLELFASGQAPLLFISGVNPETRMEDIRALWTGETALPPGGIHLGHKATNTRENADETLDWIARDNLTSIRLVTANYHYLRARLEFKAHRPDLEIIPHPVSGQEMTLGNPKFWTVTFAEYNKFVITAIRIFFIPPAKR